MRGALTGSVPPGLLPLVGAAIGGAGAGVYLLLGRMLPPLLAALFTVMFWTAISAVSYENRWMLVGIALSVPARCWALAHLATPHVLEVCILSQAVPRAAMVALAWISRPAAGGLPFSSTLTTGAALLAIAQGAAVAFLLGPRAGLIIAGSGYFLVRGGRACLYRLAGGVNQGGLFAIEQVFETLILFLFTSSRFCGL